MTKNDRERCSWATTDFYKEYHDKEWGKPVHDDGKLFEMLILEGCLLYTSDAADD